MREVEFANGEYYHIFNRGVEKRKIFLDDFDIQRFFKSMAEFNSVEPIGSIYENSFNKKDETSQLGHRVSKLRLIELIAYSLNPNHYHLILKQIKEKGIEKYMHRLGMGYAKYFNNKYKRSGSLFQGKFKAVLIENNEQLLYTNAYVNLNFKVHSYDKKVDLFKTSWNEYVGENNENFCKKDIILEQFENISDYKNYADDSLNMILENKKRYKELE